MKLTEEKINNLLLEAAEASRKRYKKIVDDEFELDSEEDVEYCTVINTQLFKKYGKGLYIEELAYGICPCCFASEIIIEQTSKAGCHCILRQAMKNNIVEGTVSFSFACLSSWQDENYPQILLDIETSIDWFKKKIKPDTRESPKNDYMCLDCEWANKNDEIVCYECSIQISG